LLKVSEKSLAENNELGRSDLRITNHQPSTINHHDHTASNNTVAASAAGDPGGPPRSPAPSPDPSVPPTKLTSEETWRQRLAGYDPSRPRQTWKPFWGPTPDAAGHQPLIPKDLLRWWREGREHAAD
jgi:hypothetical protein